MPSPSATSPPAADSDSRLCGSTPPRSRSSASDRHCHPRHIWRRFVCTSGQLTLGPAEVMARVAGSTAISCRSTSSPGVLGCLLAGEQCEPAGELTQAQVEQSQRHDYDHRGPHHQREATGPRHGQGSRHPHVTLRGRSAGVSVKERRSGWMRIDEEPGTGFLQSHWTDGEKSGTRGGNSPQEAPVMATHEAGSWIRSLRSGRVWAE
jgi:hypothetical protein